MKSQHIKANELFNKQMTVPFAHSVCPLTFLLQRNELWRVSSTNTRAVVLHGLVWDRELSKVMTNHLSLDFNVVETLSVVHTNDASDHLRNNNHVTKMSLHRLRALILRASSLLQPSFGIHTHYRLMKSLQKSHRLSLQSTTESTTSTSLQAD